MVTDEERRQALIEETLGLMRRVLTRSLHVRQQRPGVLSIVFAREHMALHFVLRMPGATHADMAKFLGVTPSHVSHIVDSLERRGLVVRTADAEDRRVHRLEPTAKAIESHRRLHERYGELSSPIFDGWTVEEVEALRSMFRRLEASQARPGRSSAPAPRGSPNSGARLS